MKIDKIEKGPGLVQQQSNLSPFMLLLDIPAVFETSL